MFRNRSATKKNQQVMMEDVYKIDWDMCIIYLSRKMKSSEILKLLTAMVKDAKIDDREWTFVIVGADN